MDIELGNTTPSRDVAMTDIDEELLEKTLERVEAMEVLAERILSECRVTLMMSFRFLDRALWKLPFRSLRFCNKQSPVRLTRQSMLATDGHALYYNAKAVIGAFRSNPDKVVRAYLHTLLHCIFRHPFRTVRVDMPFWALACDICVETIALEMCAGRFLLDGDELIDEYAKRVAEFCKGMTPSKIYRMLLLSRRGEASGETMRLITGLDASRDFFARDDHQLWDLLEPPKDEEQPDSPGGGGASGDGEDSADESKDGPDDPDNAQSGEVPDSDGEESDLNPDEGAEPSDSNEGGMNEENTEDEDGQGNAPGEDDNHPLPPEGEEGSQRQQQQEETVQAEPEYSEAEPFELQEPINDGNDEVDWEQIAKQVETALQTLEKQHGDAAGTFMDNLALANRSRVNYEDFMRRFATWSEDAKLNDEEFDYIFYTYGLKLYENMPLVEPLEYKESERIREFAIAVDTSGSCSHGLVQQFLTRTYEILSRCSNFDDHVNVHIIQCDADIQSDVVIHDVIELEEYTDGFTVRGYGGTDFRPVFAYVDELIAQKEFTDLKGLVYFTDGYGTFPTVSPEYDVAFVFVEEEGKQRRVPPWAMKVVLDENALYEMDRIE